MGIDLQGPPIPVTVPHIMMKGHAMSMIWKLGLPVTAIPRVITESKETIFTASDGILDKEEALL